jgi:single-stranded DNA-binding protein
MNNCKVGSSVVVEGYLSLGKLELPDGSVRNMHEVVTENVLLLQVSGDERIGVFKNHADFEDDDLFFLILKRRFST